MDEYNDQKRENKKQQYRCSIVDNMQINILRRFGHVLKKGKGEIVRLAKEMYVEGKMRRKKTKING